MVWVVVGAQCRRGDVFVNGAVGGVGIVCFNWSDM